MLSVCRVGCLWRVAADTSSGGFEILTPFENAPRRMRLIVNRQEIDQSREPGSRPLGFYSQDQLHGYTPTDYSG